MSKRHRDREFEAELETIRHRITTMGRTVEQMMTDSVDAFSRMDDDLAPMAKAVLEMVHESI